MDYGYFKDLPRRTASDKVLRGKALILLKIQNMTDMKRVLFQWLINCLMKIIRNSKNRRLYSPLKITFGMEINQIRN